ncbi:hypothetical protein QNA24_29965 [Rhodococcus qingshengii]|uniref:hypothetical protein n=1 Tax=Rhodococcus TaxID=1827 RepID=UPI001E488760|nr:MULTISPECIES: hypothetical protein [Rhodococcus]MCD2099596.1 hypothetical protein [Rhodococcus rhodochrous]MCD2123964.1 hypothetical protein [Rhodococcus rhodochrous]MCQ4136605.1 hypothetical protein [Rhodococcus rhodochrous]MDJ0490610.1 hypothetical protein [Rhodococcus qingshengii]
MPIRNEIANLLDRHMSDRDYDQGCRLACGYSGDDRDEHLADAILERFGVVELPKPRIMTERELSELDPGAEPELWMGPIRDYYVQENVIVSDLGYTYSAATLRREAAAMLAAAHALETKENNR